MNRTLRRPMFRIGGTAEGITSGLSRQGYERGRVVNPGGDQGDIPPGVRGRLYPNQTTQTTIPQTTGADTQSIIDQVKQRTSILDAMYPREKTSSMAGPNFLMNWGIDLATRPRGGNILQQAATSAKNPLLQFQQEKLMEQAAGRKETSEDRALLADILEGMDDEKLSAMMKDVKKGVEAGYYKDEMEGIRRKLAEEEFGVMDMPGEADIRRLNVLEQGVISEDTKSTAYARQIAEHMHKMQTGKYPQAVQTDLSKYPVYIKPRHKAADIKPKLDENGAVMEFVVQGNQDRTYGYNKIFYDPDTGYLFKRVSKQGTAPVFVRVEFD